MWPGPYGPTRFCVCEPLINVKGVAISSKFAGRICKYAEFHFIIFDSECITRPDFVLSIGIMLLDDQKVKACDILHPCQK